MIKNVGVFVMLSVTLLVLSACELTSALPSQPTDITSEALLPNLLVQVEGNVLLRRSGWVDFVPVGFGTVISPGDLLRVGDGAVAKVFCGADGTWNRGTNSLAADGAEHGVPCTTGRPPRPWLDVVALRAEPNASIPYIISPRNTALLSNQPLLRWHSLEGVELYTVSVVGDDGYTRSAKEVSESHLEWPADWPPIQPEANYVVVIEGGDKRSDAGTQGNVGLGFWLLPEKEAAVVREKEAILRSVGLEPPAVDLLIAEIYTYYSLQAEAVRLLESLAAGQNAASVWLSLGQAYLDMGLAVQASTAFEEALASAQQMGEREAEAAALVGAGLASRYMNDESAGRASLEAAQTLYEQIGDLAAVAQVKLLISK